MGPLRATSGSGGRDGNAGAGSATGSSGSSRDGAAAAGAWRSAGWLREGLGGGTEAAPNTCVVVGEGALAATAGAPKTWVVVGEGAEAPGTPNTWVFPPGAREGLGAGEPKAGVLSEALSSCVLAGAVGGGGTA